MMADTATGAPEDAPQAPGPAPRRVLVVEDEESLRHVLTVILQDAGYEVRAVPDGAVAKAELARRDFEVVITDVRMPKVGGMQLLDHLRETAPSVTVIVMSAYGSHETALEAMKRGAYDYISKPFKPDEVVLVLRKAEEREQLRRENARLKAELDDKAGLTGLDGLVGGSPGMQALFQKLRRIAGYKTTVLLTGESGTGKELVARALHRLSPRSDAPFVPVNCGAIPEALMESELFGHVKGAFTGAHAARDGLVTAAHGGTLFLDEIGELPLSLQVKLLRFLQEEEIRRVGDSRTTGVDVRVVAATARDLSEEIAAGRFREDLYYRLNVVPLELPPLRDRGGDIPLLVAHFLDRLGARLGKQVDGASDAALALLGAYPWPGNVRELENTLEQAVVLCDGPRLEADDLPEKLRRTPKVDWQVPADTLSLKRATRFLEAELIRRALERTGGNRTRAAELLEISHRALLYKLKSHGID